MEKQRWILPTNVKINSAIELLSARKLDIQKKQAKSLFDAISRDDVSCVEDILTLAISIGNHILYERDDFEFYPIMRAAQYGNLNILELLISNGADINVIHRPTGNSVLYEAALNSQKEVVFFLIEKGAHYNVKNFIGQTVMHACAISGSVSIAQKLYDLGLPLDTCDQQDRTPLNLAEIQGKKDFVTWVRKNIDLSVPSGTRLRAFSQPPTTPSQSIYSQTPSHTVMGSRQRSSSQSIYPTPSQTSAGKQGCTSLYQPNLDKQSKADRVTSSHDGTTPPIPLEPASSSRNTMLPETSQLSESEESRSNVSMLDLIRAKSFLRKNTKSLLLKKFPVLTILDLSNSQLTTTDINCLISVLRDNSQLNSLSLQKVNLSQNIFGDEGFIALFPLLEACKDTLQELNLSKNQFCHKSLLNFQQDYLPILKKLTMLELTGSILSLEVKMSLMDYCWKNNISLKIDMESDISDSLALKISTPQQKTKSVTEIVSDEKKRYSIFAAETPLAPIGVITGDKRVVAEQAEAKKANAQDRAFLDADKTRLSQPPTHPSSRRVDRPRSGEFSQSKLLGDATIPYESIPLLTLIRLCNNDKMAITALIERFPKIKKLELIKVGLTTTDIELLVDVLESNGKLPLLSLRQINLSQNSFGDDGLIALFPLLQACVNSLSEINLANNALSRKSIFGLANKVIPKLNELFSLNVTGNTLDEESCQLLQQICDKKINGKIDLEIDTILTDRTTSFNTYPSKTAARKLVRSSSRSVFEKEQVAGKQVERENTEKKQTEPSPTKIHHPIVQPVRLLNKPRSMSQTTKPDPNTLYAEIDDQEAVRDRESVLGCDPTATDSDGESNFSGHTSIFYSKDPEEISEKLQLRIQRHLKGTDAEVKLGKKRKCIEIELDIEPGAALKNEALLLTLLILLPPNTYKIEKNMITLPWDILKDDHVRHFKKEFLGQHNRLLEKAGKVNQQDTTGLASLIVSLKTTVVGGFDAARERDGDMQTTLKGVSEGIGMISAAHIDTKPVKKAERNKVPPQSSAQIHTTSDNTSKIGQKFTM